MKRIHSAIAPDQRVSGDTSPATAADPMELLRLFAERHRLPSSEESRGLCLHMTLVLAWHARELGLQDRVRFARWKVTDDPEFREHWALVWHDGLVLDMAAAQVDGDPTPVRALAGYPSSYATPRTYALAPLLACFGPGTTLDAQARYPRSLILRLHRRMFRLDFADAARHFSVLRMAAASMRFAESLFVLAMSFALEKAIQRLSRALMRLN